MKDPELARWQGAGLTPQTGCKLVELPLGDSSAWVEYEYTPEDPGRYSGPPENCYPSEPAEVVILNVLINGTMCDSEVIAPDVLEQWTQQIFDIEAEPDVDPAEYFDGDDYYSQIAADKYERELDAKASQ